MPQSKKQEVYGGIKSVLREKNSFTINDVRRKVKVDYHIVQKYVYELVIRNVLREVILRKTPHVTFRSWELVKK